MGDYNNRDSKTRHLRPNGYAKGVKTLDGKWKWEKTSWVKCHCGLWHSNRKIPRIFWKQEWVINNTTDRKKVGIILIRDNKEVWITQSYHKCFGFPKGEKEKGETVEECARREFLEETGYEINNLNLDACVRIGTFIEDVEYIFYIWNVPKSFNLSSFPLDDVEITSCGWFPIKNLGDLKLSKAIRKIFRVSMKKNLFV